MRAGFLRIFWGLLLVVLDIRIDSVDLILPDFVGYILIVSGLTPLVQYDKWFRRARVVAFIMIFVSLITFVEVKVDAEQAPKLKREWISMLTGELSNLLPEQVDSARLVRVTSSGAEIDANRTHNPLQDKDRILGEYSDGTIVMILRYASPDEALLAMEQKGDSEYSTAAIRKRGETDASFRTNNITIHHGSTGSDKKYAAYSNVEAADRTIQQWWNRGWSWWKPHTWGEEGGWSDRLLYIVEGSRATASAYKSAFENKRDKGNGVTLDALFPFSALVPLLDVLLIWGLCSGVIAISLASNNHALVQTAKRRRNLYLALAALGVALSMTWFLAPVAVSHFVKSPAGGFVIIVAIICALLVILSAILIMGLMRKAANTFAGNQL
jgi:hypothetical protein